MVNLEKYILEKMDEKNNILSMKYIYYCSQSV